MKDFITQSRFMELISYDPDTGIFTNLTARGKNIKVGTVAGSLTNSGHMRIYVDGVRYFSHRLAWMYVHGSFPLKCIDHINGIPSDNRIINLRECSLGENQQNIRQARAASKTGILGVSKTKPGRFDARIAVNGKTIHLGSFDLIEDATLAYLTAKQKYHPFQTITSIGDQEVERLKSVQRPLHSPRKLSRGDMEAIRMDERKYAEIAKDFCIDSSYVSRIKTGAAKNV